MNQENEFENGDLLLGDLSDVGVELGTAELAAVSGAQRMVPSHTSGNPERNDEWWIR